MRDKRFVAVHRGGSLDSDNHELLALWAADCAERVIPIFEKHSSDERPRNAIAVARAWARGEVLTGPAQMAACAAHAAAREVTKPEVILAARSAGHAVATAHFADHSLVAAYFALKTLEKGGRSPTDESLWQISQLPEAIRKLVTTGIERRFPASALAPKRGLQG